jgi:hypothetical protein
MPSYNVTSASFPLSPVMRTSDIACAVDGSSPLFHYTGQWGVSTPNDPNAAFANTIHVPTDVRRVGASSCLR